MLLDMVITGHKNLLVILIPKYNVVSKVYKVYKIVIKDILLKPIFFSSIFSSTRGYNIRSISIPE